MSEPNDSSDDLLLVPSAIQVPNELRLDVGNVPTGMIPLDGKPMLEHLAEAYADFDVTRVVAVGESADSIRTYVDRSDYSWTVIDATSTSSLGETVHTALDSFNTDNLRGRSVYVNFADTLISPLRAVVDESVMSYKVRDRTYRWTTFDVESEKIVNVTDKNKRADNGLKPCFTGQFGLVDAKEFYRTLQETPARSNADLDYFYRALLSYLDCTDYELYQPDSWLDVGHLDTYHRAKKRFLNAREFNKIENHEKNLITKRSSDTETLINEIMWYRNLPAELQPYLPRIYDSSTDLVDPYVKMEYIGYPSLSDLQLYGSHRQHIWDDVFHRIFSMHREFQTFTADANEERVKNALEAMYLDKTRRRLTRLRGEDRFQSFLDADTIRVNGVDYPSVSEILKHLDEVVAESDLLTRESLSIIHGDLCLPNILYDPRNEILKLIDPRGKFGELDIYGDPRYDLAKLRHSVVGHYEHLINGRFEATGVATDATLSYEIYTTSEQEQRENRFDMILTSETDANLETVKLIEALLFLSMVPLHRDSSERQQCMLAQGIEKFSPFLE
jgi:serine/threonine protein kinase